MLTAIEFIALTRLTLAASNGELPEELDRDVMDAIFAKLSPLVFKMDIYTHVSLMPTIKRKERPLAEYQELPY